MPAPLAGTSSSFPSKEDQLEKYFQAHDGTGYVSSGFSASSYPPQPQQPSTTPSSSNPPNIQPSVATSPTSSTSALNQSKFNDTNIATVTTNTSLQPITSPSTPSSTSASANPQTTAQTNAPPQQPQPTQSNSTSNTIGRSTPSKRKRPAAESSSSRRITSYFPRAPVDTGSNSDQRTTSAAPTTTIAPTAPTSTSAQASNPAGAAPTTAAAPVSTAAVVSGASVPATSAEQGPLRRGPPPLPTSEEHMSHLVQLEKTIDAQQQQLAQQQCQQSELISVLRDMTDKLRLEQEISLQRRRQSIGRVVLMNDIHNHNRNGFSSDRDRIEMWYEGTDVDEKRQELADAMNLRDKNLLAIHHIQDALVRTGEYKLSKSAAGGITRLTKRRAAPTPRTTAAAPATAQTSKTDMTTPMETSHGTVVDIPVTISSYANLFPPYLFDPNSQHYDPLLHRSGVHNSNSHLSLQQILRGFEAAVRLLDLKISACHTQLADFEVKKKHLIRDERLFLEEQMSLFKDKPILDQRYLILQMLGKGGFSEVFRSYDIICNRYVACKIHVIQPSWTYEKKTTYIRHVKRECEIQAQLDHPHIVKLHEVVVIDADTLMLVLEQCNDGDLDTYLKVQGRLGEEESTCIMIQILDALFALKYHYGQGHHIIHYDLKPGNILFHHGVAKISDFGLSKQQAAGSDTIDLTSHGAGTAGYLPPECFSPTAKISPAVDIWACGVIMYQMIYGDKPFDRVMTPNGQAPCTSIAQVINQIPLLAFPDDLPDAPPISVNSATSATANASSAVPNTAPPQRPFVGKISDRCKDFIRACLTLAPEERLTIEEALVHPLFTETPPSSKKSTG